MGGGSSTLPEMKQTNKEEGRHSGSHAGEFGSRDSGCDNGVFLEGDNNRSGSHCPCRIASNTVSLILKKGRDR